MTNFARDLDDMVASTLRERGYDPDRGSSAFRRYAALRDRTSRAIPRQVYEVHISRELREHPNYSGWKPVLDEIKLRAERGEPITPYVSTNATRPGGRRDMLFSSWGINHLHLSSSRTIDKRGHVARSDYLLFVKTTGNALYFLDVQPHAGNKFVQRRLLEIIDSNWPEQLATVQGLIGDRGFSDDEMRSLMSNGYSFAVRLTTRVVFPDLGISTDGVSSATSIEYTRYLQQLKLLDSQIRREFPRFFGVLPQYIAQVKLIGIDARECHVVETFSSTSRIVTFT